MKILVPVKRVADPNVRISVAADGSGVDLTKLRMAMNPFDEIAVEEAVRLRESGTATEVIAVSIGGPKCVDTLRSALATGVDRALHITTDADLEPLAVASILTTVAEDLSPDLILMGKQAANGENGQTGQMLAAKLGWPQATFASKIEASDGTLTVTREVDQGLETIEVDLPCVVTTDLCLNAPRFAAVSAILKAKKAPIEERAAENLGMQLSPRLRTLSVGETSQDRANIKVTSVGELLEALAKTHGLLK
jgi:electron transfer flavoprotein beta subunit